MSHGKDSKSFLAIVAALLLVWALPLAAQQKVQHGVIDEGCAQKLAALEEELYAAAKCEKDEDCMVAYIGCPFGCGTPLREGFDTAIFDVKKKMYENECGGCAYRCSAEQRELMCATGRCRLIPHAEIEQWRKEERDEQERQRQEYIQEKEDRLQYGR